MLLIKYRDYYGSGDGGINNALPKNEKPPEGGEPEKINFTDNDFSIKKRKGIKGFMSNGAGIASDTYGAFMGNGSFFEMGEKYLKNKPKFLDEAMQGSKHEWVRKLGDKTQGLREKAGITDERIEKAKSFGKEFEKIGGFQELYKGFNEIRDTMFVNGAPQDWKNTAKEMDENKKRKDDMREYNFTHDEGNRQYIIKEMNLKEKAEAKYPGDPSKQTDWIDSKVDKELSQLAKSYLPLGVKDAALAYTLRREEIRTGQTPLQAYSNYAKGAGFGAFNSNINVVNQVNNTTGGSYSNVSDAVPNAKDFWDNGYRDINHMQDAQMIKETLRTSVDMAMKLEQALRTKGKVSYNGNDKAIEAKFKEINDYYEKMRKNKK